MGERNQQFDSREEWINKGQSWLTRHPQWGEHFKAICFDTKGRHVACGGDFRRAEEEGAFPVRWLWPDQVAQTAALNSEMVVALKAAATVVGAALISFSRHKDETSADAANTVLRQIEAVIAKAEAA